MVDAVEAGDALGEIVGFDWEVAANKLELPIEEKVAKVFKKTQKSEFPPININNPVFYQEVANAVCDAHIARLIITKLKEKGLDDYEKYLGHGAFGKVFQLEGKGVYEGKKLALKLLPYYSSDSYYSYWGDSNRITEHGAQGDAIALQLPKGHHLSRAYAVLTFDGKEVHYLEKINPKQHKGHVVIGILSQAIQGGTLGERIHKLPMNAEAVRSYGKQLAEALHGLHQAGYVHGDLHTGNILVKAHKVGKPPYRIKLADFGLTRKTSLSSDSTTWDWKHFGIILGQMALKTELEFDPGLKDLLGLIMSKNCYSEEAILNHPFFA